MNFFLTRCIKYSDVNIEQIKLGTHLSTVHAGLLYTLYLYTSGTVLWVLWVGHSITVNFLVGLMQTSSYGAICNHIDATLLCVQWAKEDIMLVT